MKNTAASVRQRLTNLAKERGVALNRILIQYGIERVLYRISQSKHADKFVLKGAMLFLLWQGVKHRETRDLDLLGHGDNSVDAMLAAFRDICAESVDDDGLTFEGVSATPITALEEYGGVNVKIKARLEAAKIPVHVDVGFGDSVTPKPKLVNFPVLLDFPAPRVRAYPIETVVAEKFQAIVALGERNSRMKDFFDLLYLSNEFEFDGATLCQAIRATFDRRKTPVPSGFPVVLTEPFAESSQRMWSAFLKRSEQPDTIKFPEVTKALRNFLGPVITGLANEPFLKHWDKGVRWRATKLMDLAGSLKSDIPYMGVRAEKEAVRRARAEHYTKKYRKISEEEGSK